MNFVSILLCVMLASVAQSARITKLRLTVPHIPQNKATPSPEEIRQLSIFPRSNWKFIVTPLVYRKYVTQRPITLTKNPLMKKIVFQDRLPNLMVERTSKPPVMNTKLLSVKPMDLFKKSIQTVHTKSDMDFIDEATEVSSGTLNNIFYDGDFSVHGDYSEDIAAVVFPNKVNNEGVTLTKDNEKSALKIDDFLFTPQIKPTEAMHQSSVLNIEDFIFTSKVKPVQVKTVTAATIANMKNWNEKDNGASPEEVADRNEFIFLNEKNKQNIIPDVPEELIPITDVIFTSKSRVKRSVNVIEEEDFGTTVSGFKYTARDTADLVFKNINS